MDHHQADGLRSQERFTFAQVPLVMRRDPMLESTDIPVTMFVLPWMRGRPYGWSTLERIASGANVSERTVQRSLIRLARAGWFGIEKTRFNPSRREFTALWLTDFGYERLVTRLGITANSEQLPQLVYSPVLASFGTQKSTNEQDVSRSLQLQELPVDSCMQGDGRDARSPQGETALNSASFALPATEDARNAAAIDRGVRGVHRSRVPRGIMNVTVGCVARLVAKRLNDGHSHAFHCGVLWRVADGDLTPDVYLNALDTALTEPCTREGEAIRSRGARFKAMVEAMEVRRTDAEFAEEWDDQHTVA